MKRIHGGEDGMIADDVKEQLQQVKASLQNIAERLTANNPLLENVQQSVAEMNAKMSEINQNCVAAQQRVAPSKAENEDQPPFEQQNDDTNPPPEGPLPGNQPATDEQQQVETPPIPSENVATNNEVKMSDEEVLQEINGSTELTEDEKQQYKRYFTVGDELYNPDEGIKQLEELLKRKAAIQQLGGYLSLHDMTDYSGLFFTLICFVISLIVIERVIIPSKYSIYEYSIPIAFAITYTSLLGIITIAGGIDRNMFMVHITSMVIILTLMFLLWKHKCSPNYGVALLFAWLVSLWWAAMIASIR